MVAVFDDEKDVLLLKTTTDADVEVLGPAAMLVGAVSVTAEGSGVITSTAHAALDAGGDKLLESARAQELVRTGGDVAMYQVVLDNVDANMLVLNTVADDDVLLLNTCVNVVGVQALVILQVVDDINTYVLTALGTEDEVPLLDNATDTDIEEIAYPAMLVHAVSTTVQGSRVILFAALPVLDVDGDVLLDSAKAQVLVDTGVEGALNPLVLEEVEASTHVWNTVANDAVLLFNICTDGVGSPIIVMLEMAYDVNTPVVTALAAEKNILLLETAAHTDGKVTLPPAMPVGTVCEIEKFIIRQPPIGGKR